MSDEQEHDPDELYPQWIKQLFSGKMGCESCSEPLSLDDIIGVGLYCPDAATDFSVGPQSAVEAYCSHCGNRTHFTINKVLSETVKAVEAFYEVIARKRMGHKPPWGTLPSPNYKPEEEADKKQPGSDVRPYGHRFRGQGFSEEAERWRNRRRRRRFKIGGPPSDEEVKKFLRRLEKTSFKRSTKSFQKFMADMGITIEDGGES